MKCDGALSCLWLILAVPPSAAWMVHWPRPWRTATLLRYEEQDHAMDAFSQAMQAYQQQPPPPFQGPPSFDPTPSNLQQQSDPSFPFQPQQQQQQQQVPPTPNNGFAATNNEASPGNPSFPPPPQQQQPAVSEPLVSSEPYRSTKQLDSGSINPNMILGGPPALEFEPVEQTEELNRQQSSNGYTGRPGENPPGATFESIQVDTGAWDIWNGKNTNVKSEVPSVKQQQQQQQRQQQQTNVPSQRAFDRAAAQQQQHQDLMWTEGSSQPAAPVEEPKYTGRPGENPPGATFESVKVDTGAWDMWSGKDSSGMKSQVPTGSYKDREKQQQPEAGTTSSSRESHGELYDIRSSSKQAFVTSRDETQAGPSDYGPLCTFERINVDSDAWAAWTPAPQQQAPPPAPQQQQQSFVPPPVPQQQIQQQQQQQQMQQQQQAAAYNSRAPENEARSESEQNSRSTQQQSGRSRENPEPTMPFQSSVEMQNDERMIRQQYQQAQGAPEISQEQPSMVSGQAQSLVSSEPQKSFGQYQPDYGEDCTFEPVGVDLGAWGAWVTPESGAPPPETKPPAARRDVAQTKPPPQQMQRQPPQPKAPREPPPAATKQAKRNVERKLPRPVMNAPETQQGSASKTPKSSRFAEIDTDAPSIMASTKLPQQKNGLSEVADMVKDAFLSGNSIKPPPDQPLEEAVDGRFVFNINTQVGKWLKKPKYRGQDWTAYFDNYGNFNVCYFEDKECPPEQTQKSGSWSQFVTKNGEVYYYNEKTQESQWNPPKGFKVRAKKPTQPPPSVSKSAPSVQKPDSEETGEKETKSKSWSLFSKQENLEEETAVEKPIAPSSKEEKSDWSGPWKKGENPILSALTANEPDTDWLKPPKQQAKKTVAETKAKQKKVESEVDIVEEANRARMAAAAREKAAPTLNLFDSTNLFNRNKTADDATLQASPSKSRRDNQAPKPSPTMNLFNWNKTESDSSVLTKKARAEVLARKAALEAKQRAQKKDQDRPSKSLFNFSAENKPETQNKASPTPKKSPTMPIFGGAAPKTDDKKPPPRLSSADKSKTQPTKRSPTKSIASSKKGKTRVVRKPKGDAPTKKSLAERKADLERRRKEYDEKWKFRF